MTMTMMLSAQVIEWSKENMCTAVDVDLCTCIVFVLVFVFALFALEKLHLEIRKQTQSKNIEIKQLRGISKRIKWE